jgi:hypothetical protein
LQTDAGKKLAKEILKTNPSDWWYADKEDPYWITGGKVKK